VSSESNITRAKNANNTKNAKTALRKEYRWQRKQQFIDNSWIHILDCKEFQEASCVASYISYGVEPQTRDINKALLQQGKRVLVPRLLPDNDLEWIELDRESNPQESAVTNLSDVGVLIIPALRVDKKGTRLGQGGGSYDRALPRFSGWKIALVHSGEISTEELPRESHDAIVDAAATPEVVIRFN
jgi:5-formyltetrahydrofolate cyclo-ligase